MDDYITKPVRLNDLQAILMKYAGEPDQRQFLCVDHIPPSIRPACDTTFPGSFPAEHFSIDTHASKDSLVHDYSSALATGIFLLGCLNALPSSQAC